MNCRRFTLLSVLFAVPLFAVASEQIIPAGALIQCTTSEPKLNSKTTAIGDPVLCQVGHAERFGRAILPYNSYLVGRFEDYKDPGHFVGKGWMELKFDRMVVEPNTIIPVDAKVVGVPGYNVDRDGRILGKGHAVRDAVMWSIPILWPVDLLMLPERGPRPTLKTETRLTLKVMDDLEVPDTAQPQADPNGLMHRVPTAELAPPPASFEDQAPQATAMADDPSVSDQSDPGYQQAPPVVAYLPPPVMMAPPVGMAYSGYGYAPSNGGYAYAAQGGGRAYAVRPYSRVMGYGPVRYAAAPRGYPGMPRGYAGAPRGYAMASRGYGNAGGQRAYGGGYRSGGSARGAAMGGGGRR
jgi:hypothetical protein